jgi:hypothetical protein
MPDYNAIAILQTRDRAYLQRAHGRVRTAEVQPLLSAVVRCCPLLSAVLRRFHLLKKKTAEKSGQLRYNER